MILQDFSRYTSDSIGLEKFLRALQGIIQLILALSHNRSSFSTYSSYIATAYPTLRLDIALPIALKQIAVTRRAFRYFRWIDFSAVAVGKVKGVVGWGGGGERKGDGEGVVMGVLEGGRAGCMAVYLFLEAWTILHAIGILTSPWGALVFFEAQKFWFYAISCSILSLSYQLLVLRDDEKKVKQQQSEKKKVSADVKGTKRGIETARNVLVWQLVGASCDLLIPGTFVGWFDVNPAVVAATSILSSVLASIDVWKRVNRGK